MVKALTAAEMGASAFRHGFRLRNNPFRIGSAARSKWSAGWKAAKAEADQAADEAETARINDLIDRGIMNPDGSFN